MSIEDLRIPIRPVPQPLSALLAGLQTQLPTDDPIIGGVSFDSRRVNPGDLYVGLPGKRRHGAEFAAVVKQQGAAAMLTDAAGAKIAADSGLVMAISAEPRFAMAIAATRCWGNPARSMLTFGVTGTNGKSTTILMLAAALDYQQYRVGTIGTLGFRVAGQPIEVEHSTITTPEAPDLQSAIATLRNHGADVMAMEVSSHALALDRVAGIQFDVVGFTNLGRDHLDFHHTLEAYFQAKAQLFTCDYAQRAVIMTDDEAGRSLLRQAQEQGLSAVSVGTARECAYQIVRRQPEGPGSRFVLKHPRGFLEGRTCLPGEYNIRNAATALAMIDQAGLDMHSALPGLAAAVVPGRMQPVLLAGAEAPRAYVDFAHTPQAIASALSAFDHPDRGQGRVIAVFGAGGDRDPDKREAMGAAGVCGADVVIVTDDNPRSEKPSDIRARVLAGAHEAAVSAEPGSRRAKVEIYDGESRDDAIQLALTLASPDDAVVILGKGHERTQELADRTIEFDDVAVVQKKWQHISEDMVDRS